MWDGAIVPQIYECFPLQFYRPLRVVCRQFCSSLPDFDLEFARARKLLCVLCGPGLCWSSGIQQECCVQFRFLLQWSSRRSNVVQLLCSHLDLIHSSVLRLRSFADRFDCIQFLFDLAEDRAEVQAFLLRQHFAARRTAAAYRGFFPCVIRVDTCASSSSHLRIRYDDLRFVFIAFVSVMAFAILFTDLGLIAAAVACFTLALRYCDFCGLFSASFLVVLLSCW